MLSGPKRKALIQGCLCCLPELFLNLLIYSSICLPIKPLLSTYYVQAVSYSGEYSSACDLASALMDGRAGGEGGKTAV